MKSQGSNCRIATYIVTGSVEYLIGSCKLTQKSIFSQIPHFVISLNDEIDVSSGNCLTITHHLLIHAFNSLTQKIGAKVIAHSP